MESQHYFYVYALKDPTQGGQVFYVGKGQGDRKTDHVLQLDDSPKSQRIKAIQDSGETVIIEELVSGLTESAALKIEAELIGTFGTTATGGHLLNQVIPTGHKTINSQSISIPVGSQEKATIGRKLLEDSILSFVAANPAGVRNVDVARYLGLRSSHGGRQRDYLTYSILGNLLADGRLRRERNRYRTPT